MEWWKADVDSGRKLHEVASSFVVWICSRNVIYEEVARGEEMFLKGKSAKAGRDDLLCAEIFVPRRKFSLGLY